MERLAQLARIGGSSSGGVTRSGLGRDEQHACELVASWMAEDGLEVSWDAAGNLFDRGHLQGDLHSAHAGERVDQYGDIRALGFFE